MTTFLSCTAVLNGSEVRGDLLLSFRAGFRPGRFTGPGTDINMPLCCCCRPCSNDNSTFKPGRVALGALMCLPGALATVPALVGDLNYVNEDNHEDGVYFDGMPVTDYCVSISSSNDICVHLNLRLTWQGILRHNMPRFAPRRGTG